MIDAHLPQNVGLYIEEMNERLGYPNERYYNKI